MGIIFWPLGSRGGKKPCYEWAGCLTTIFLFFSNTCSSVLSRRVSHLAFTTPCQGGIVGKYWELSKIFFLKVAGLAGRQCRTWNLEAMPLSSGLLPACCFPFRSLPLKSRITWGQSEDMWLLLVDVTCGSLEDTAHPAKQCLREQPSEAHFKRRPSRST